MTYLVLKFAVTAGIVVGVSELSKRSVLWGGLLASLPLTSYLAFLWLYAETKDSAKIAALSKEILWLVLPSLILFAALPIFITRLKWGFLPALAASTALMLVGYGAFLKMGWK